jgi:hypothetical protein
MRFNILPLNFRTADQITTFGSQFTEQVLQLPVVETFKPDIQFTNMVTTLITYESQRRILHTDFLAAL